MKKIAIGDRRFVITKNLIMMLVMLVVIFIAIFAWYTSSYAVTAETTSISAQAADNVELALPVNGEFPVNNSEWKTEISFNASEYLKNLVKDVTSNGEQFVVPNFEAAKSLKDGRTVIPNDVWTEGLSSKVALSNGKPLDDDQYNYISFDFYLRAKSKTINVNADSFLAAGSELGINKDGEIADPPVKRALVGSNVYRCSTYGDAEGNANAFSSDAIIGAMRVSLVGTPVASVSGTTETLQGNEELKFVWLPRPDVYLDTSDNQNDWRLYTGIKPTDTNADKTYCHSFYYGKTVEGTDVKKGLEKQTYWDTAVKAPESYTKPANFYVSKVTEQTDFSNFYIPTLGQSAEIANNAPDSSAQITFTKDKQDDDRSTTGYYVYKYTMNIWIEGEDAEARRSMNNGVFSLELDFGT